MREEWSADLDARSRSLADYEASLLARRREIEDEADIVARREARIAAEKREIAERAEAIRTRDAEVLARETEAAARLEKAGEREAAADASLATVEALVDGVAEAVVVEGTTRIRPAKSASAASRWPALKARMSAAPEAALGMAERLRVRIEQLRGMAIDEARQEAREELSTAFKKVETLWSSVQDISTRFAGLVARLSPQDRRELDEARVEIRRAAGAKAAAAREVGSTARGEDR